MVKLKFAEKVVECKGVIFDKDCTLTDSFSMWPELISLRAAKLTNHLNLPQGAYELLCKAMGLNSVTKEVSRTGPVVVGSRLETAAAVASVLYMNYGYAWDFACRTVNSLFDRSDREMGLDKQAIPFPGLQEKMQRLHQAGCVLAVATNDSYERTKEIINLLRLQDWMKVMACADRVVNAKPYPDMVNLVCAETKLSPTDFVLVGDSLLDMEMGIRAGTRLNVGVLTGASSEQELLKVANCVITSVTDFEIMG